MRFQASPTTRPPDTVGGVGDWLARPPAVAGGVIEGVVDPGVRATPLGAEAPAAAEAAALAELVGEALAEVLGHEAVDDGVETAAG